MKNLNSDFICYAVNDKNKRITGVIDWAPEHKYGKITAFTSSGKKCYGQIIRPCSLSRKNTEGAVTNGYLKIADDNVMHLHMQIKDHIHTVKILPDDVFQEKNRQMYPKNDFLQSYKGLAIGKILYADGTVK